MRSRTVASSRSSRCARRPSRSIQTRPPPLTITSVTVGSARNGSSGPSPTTRASTRARPARPGGRRAAAPSSRTSVAVRWSGPGSAAVAGSTARRRAAAGGPGRRATGRRRVGHAPSQGPLEPTGQPGGQQPGIDGPGHAGSTGTSATTGAPTTSSTSRRPRARPGSLTSTTPDGRTERRPAAQREVAAAGHQEALGRRRRPARRGIAGAADVQRGTPQSTTTDRGSEARSPASTSARSGGRAAAPAEQEVEPVDTATSSRPGRRRAPRPRPPTSRPDPARRARPARARPAGRRPGRRAARRHDGGPGPARARPPRPSFPSHPWPTNTTANTSTSPTGNDLGKGGPTVAPGWRPPQGVILDTLRPGGRGGSRRPYARPDGGGLLRSRQDGHRQGVDGRLRPPALPGRHDLALAGGPGPVEPAGLPAPRRRRGADAQVPRVGPADHPRAGTRPASAPSCATP